MRSRCRVHWTWRVVTVVLLALLGTACGDTGSADEAAAQSADRASAPVGDLRVIQHEEPPRDIVGPRPGRFRWSAINGADRYAIGLWDEADRLLWRKDDISEPQVVWPEGLVVGPGTYFWSVSALQSGREVAKSGMAAFVVE